ncbi:MAG: SpoIID/LytB domain-containing protein [Deltaproteobacteria bacterium]|nr:SpoIID/LytB domain-containing protein [Deltaproteobacteria bacterium]
MKKIPTVVRFFYFLLGAFISWEIFWAPAVEAQTKEIIRVLILRDVSYFIVTGQALALQDLPTGQTLFKNKKVSSLTVERDVGPRLRIKGYSISAKALVVTSARGFITINGRHYRDKIRVFPGPNRDLWVINELPVEQYLVGLINAEIFSQWSLDALKAQAVAARTFAIFQKGNRSDGLYDVDSSVNDQVYAGTGLEDDRSRRAVKETEGEILINKGNPIFAVYHACCGGKTESPEYLWAGSFPYLNSVVCTYCLDSPHFLWNYQVDAQRLAKVLKGMGYISQRVGEIQLGERSKSGRVLRLFVNGEKAPWEIPGKEFRRLLGYNQLRSTNFWLKKSNGVFLFSGLGWGHGVGLCQWGAKGMADAGIDYRPILKYYYQNVEIGQLPR